MVKNCPTEIGGHLEVERRKDDCLIIKELHLPQQAVSGAAYIPSHKDFAKTNPRLLSRIKGWFHSHADGDIFWSPDDEATTKNSVKVFGDFCISIVMNKDYEYKIRLDVKEGITGAVTTYDDLPLNILLQRNVSFENNCKEEIKQKIKKESFFDSIIEWFTPKSIIQEEIIPRPNNNDKP